MHDYIVMWKFNVICILGGTRRVVLLLPDGSFTMTELDNEQYASITDGDKGQEESI